MTITPVNNVTYAYLACSSRKNKAIKNSIQFAGASDKQVQTLGATIQKARTSVLKFWKNLTKKPPKPGMPFTLTAYGADGETIKAIKEFNPKTGRLSKLVHYKSDGKTVNYTIEFDQKTGKPLRQINMGEDGETVESKVEYPENLVFLKRKRRR